jgi:tRNA modification GTPase
MTGPRSEPDDRASGPALEDTIVAIATPPGRGGIGAVRLSGPRAPEIALCLFRPASAAAPPGPDPGADALPAAARRAAAGRALFGRFVSSGGEPIDDGYVLVLEAPRTFTGEATAELWAHGSPVVLRRLVQEAVRLGARPATPGEFTLRAFLNGRIDATQAEAIRDLIEARTAFQAKVAREQVAGRISRPVDGLKERLAEAVARLEACVEFSEEDEAGRFLPQGGALPEVARLRREIEALAGTFERGRRVREGVTVALAGVPNVGKSSLFNRLLEEERAIVTPCAGTTRDLLEETLDLGGLAVTLVDTAGLHDPEDAAGAEAVRRARAALDSADLKLVLLDWSRPVLEEERSLLSRLEPARALVALNKIDLPCGLGMDRALDLRRRHAALEVSARTGEGVDGLRCRLAELAAGGAAAGGEPAFVTNLRHFDLLTRAAAALARAEGAARDRLSEEYVLVDLKEALDRLGEITGEVGVEGIYERIFKNFCIGK